MAMSAFFTRFPDLAVKETRVATLTGRPDLPDGEYAFLELYCDDPACDCRRVIINVVEANSAGKVWATINYGWESPAYYAAWMRDGELSKTMLGATLDPLNAQTEYAPALLRLFEFIVTDPAYVARLKRHYQLFKANLPHKKAAQPQCKPKLKKFKRK